MLYLVLYRIDLTVAVQRCQRRLRYVLRKIVIIRREFGGNLVDCGYLYIRVQEEGRGEEIGKRKKRR